MKLTTKIILGFLLTVFLSALIFIIGFSFTDRKNYSRQFSIVIKMPQDNITGIELPPFKTILIDEVVVESKDLNYALTADCSLLFDSAPVNSDPEMLFIPGVLKDFISINSSNDTLIVRLNLRDWVEKYGNDEHEYQTISGVNLHFNVSNFDIITYNKILPIKIKNIETDSIKISSYGNIDIDSCNTQFIDPQSMNDYCKLSITNSNIKRLNLDLDNMRHWNIENCNIEEEYITASGRHDIIQYPNESSIINWIPKNKNSELNIKIQGETRKITIQ